MASKPEFGVGAIGGAERSVGAIGALLQSQSFPETDHSAQKYFVVLDDCKISHFKQIFIKWRDISYQITPRSNYQFYFCPPLAALVIHFRSFNLLNF